MDCHLFLLQALASRCPGSTQLQYSWCLKTAADMLVKGLTIIFFFTMKNPNGLNAEKWVSFFAKSWLKESTSYPRPKQLNISPIIYVTNIPMTGCVWSYVETSLDKWLSGFLGGIHKNQLVFVTWWPQGKKGNRKEDLEATSSLRFLSAKDGCCRKTCSAGNCSWHLVSAFHFPFPSQVTGCVRILIAKGWEVKGCLAHR